MDNAFMKGGQLFILRDSQEEKRWNKPQVWKPKYIKTMKKKKSPR